VNGSAVALSAADRHVLVENLVAFLRTPAEAPLGQNFIDPQDPAIVHFVRAVIEPRFHALGLRSLVDDLDNNLIFRMGPDQGRPVLLLMPYTSSHHGNLMDEPYSGRVAPGAEFGVDEACAFGRGADKKAGLAAALTVAALVQQGRLHLEGQLVMAVNTEGWSSHRGSTAIYAHLRRLGVWPDGAILCTGTGLRAAIGNRGRVDILVQVHGREAHSSQPQYGLNAIDGAHEVISRLRALRVTRADPVLGREQLTIYKLTFAPIAPHTIPAIAEFRIDRRILPGTVLDEAVEEVRAAIGDLAPFRVVVERGPYMLPSRTDPELPHVRALLAAHRTVLNAPGETFVLPHTGDAGYSCAVGVPPVEIGPSSRAQVLATIPTGPELIALSQAEAAARLYAETVRRLLC
jgi:acetylornithine deacetylase/succinyl-diaminopimelate desuccinylase-like protein